MNVNGARFHLLLGAVDWRRCRGSVGVAEKALGDIWDAAAAAGTVLDGVPGWDRQRQVVTLAPLPVSLPLTRGEPLYDAASRRGAVADRYGNLYVVADDRRSLRVEAANNGESAALFWPDQRDVPASRARGRTFVDAAPSVAAPSVAATRWLGPLAITSDDFLVAIHGTEANRADGLLRFDLVGGGAPETLLFPEGFAPNVADIAADSCGGLWLLDRGDGLRPAALFHLDQRMAPVASAAPTDVPALFQPLSGDPRTITQPAPITGVALPALTSPTALVVIDDSLILMDASEKGPARLFCLDAEATTPRPLGPVPGPAFALAWRTNEKGEVELLLAARNGNQAWLVRLERIDGIWQTRPEADVVPLRRFGGRALVRRGDAIVYDSGPVPLWVPAVAQRRLVYATDARFTTPPLDGADPQCVWDRLRLDACIPPGTALLIEARASDRKADLAPGDAGWVMQPQPYLNRDGGELPGKGKAAMAVTDVAAGRGCWDLLLQGIVGRYLQLRITLSGDGRFSPHLRALRAWYPRVSWSRFLPAIYREQPGPADFLDRFLANMEGISSSLEGRIAAAQALFDPRTAPAESLDWLASWYDTALDPAWNEDRRRLFIAHAASFFGWRGTLRGLILALRLAFDPEVSARDFDDSQPTCDAPGGIRIIESFTARRSGHLWPTSSSSQAGPQQRSLAPRWQPEEGGSGLIERWALATGAEKATAQQRRAGFDLGSEGRDASLWQRFTSEQFGFVPAIGAAERARWVAYAATQGLTVENQPQGAVPVGIAEAWANFVALPSQLRKQWLSFLAASYRSIGRLNGAWGSNWTDFGEIPIPDQLPDPVAASRDWLTFEGQILPMAATAHRFTVLLPRTRTDHDPAVDSADLALASRIVALEKPAHTIFDIRFYWAMNRVGEARLGRDSSLGYSSRAPELIAPMLLGRSWLGAGFVGGPPSSPPATAQTLRRQQLC
jgi:phage tail-like protein